MEVHQSLRDIDAIYALRKDGEIVYIGQTTNLYIRVLEHVNTGKDFDDISAVLISKYDSSNDRIIKELLEVMLIADNKPKYNKLTAKSSFDFLNMLPLKVRTKFFMDMKCSDDNYKIENVYEDIAYIYELLKKFDYMEDTVNRALHAKEDKKYKVEYPIRYQ